MELGGIERRENIMKRAAVTVVLLSAHPLWALTFMGPTTSDLRQNQTRFGIEYSTGEANVDISGPLVSGTFDDIEHDTLFARLGAAPFDKTELFVRLGMSEVGEMGNEFVWGAGFKATVFDSSPAPWGVLFQITHAEGDESDIVAGFLFSGDLDIYEMQIAVGPSYKEGNVCVYGGPFLHFINGDADISVAGQKFSHDIEQESEFGGYIGLSAEIAENVNISFEGQFTSDATAFGVGATVKF